MAKDDRLLAVLRSLNELGLCTVLDLHRATGISRPAVHRIVENLCESGYAERVNNGSDVRLTSNVLALSSGYREESWIAERARPALSRLQERLRWPLSFATPERGLMVVRETTRYRNPFVFDEGRTGLRLPMLSTALGLAYLAYCDQSTRDVTLSLLRNGTEGGLAYGEHELGRRLERTEQRGYAFRRGGVVPRTSTLAVPVLGVEVAIGALCTTFASVAASHTSATETFLPLLKDASAEISERVSQMKDARAAV